MGCGAEFSEWDRQAIADSMAGKNTGLNPGVLAQAMLEIDLVMEKSLIEAGSRNVGKSVNELRELVERLGREPSRMERYDLSIIPVQQDFVDKFKAAKEIGLKISQVVNDPVVFGTKGVVDMPGKVREVLKLFHDSKIRPEFRDVTVMDGIMFVDAKIAAGIPNVDESTGGYALLSEALRENMELPRNIHIIMDQKGVPVFKSRFIHIPEDKRLLWGLAHESLHLNFLNPEMTDSTNKNMGPAEKIINANFSQWLVATAAQFEKGPVTEYSMKDIEQRGEEFICEHYAGWVTDNAGLCLEMKIFFDEHFL
jgi:hypothetical protein